MIYLNISLVLQAPLDPLEIWDHVERPADLEDLDSKEQLDSLEDPDLEVIYHNLYPYSLLIK